VVREGNMRVGDEVTLEPYAGETITVIELFNDAFTPSRDLATIRRQLAAPIAIRSRIEKEQELSELLEQR
jgi:MOSC domain-containing protein YiiM